TEEGWLQIEAISLRFVNSKIIRKFVVSNCSFEVFMAKVGPENDTLKQPKCPSNWEYSTWQRQLLDIQSGEQMDRLSFSASYLTNPQPPSLGSLRSPR
ncbi:MAG: hypothetical protein J6K74_05335, partial [Marinifilaceae bacterium]|nr:hypothetical protein [Marinifilaceae bacterium]